MREPNPGDKVVVTTAVNQFQGIVMPRPSLSDASHLTIKLDNGYNIGIKLADIKKINVVTGNLSIKKHPPVPEASSPGKPDISIISTGGTISSRIDYRSGGVYAASTAGELLASVPELKDVANIRTVSLMNVMSEDMNPRLWKDIAVCASNELNAGASGVVITHGTDTMHYSAAALSFILPNLGKPIILTGAQRSSDRGSSDTYLNLLCSTIFATKEYGGVYVIMHGSLNEEFCFAHNGTRVRKMHTSRRDAFQSINVKPVAKVFADGRIQEVGGPLHPRENTKTKSELKLEEKVALLRIYPGMDPEIIDFYIDRDYRGLVFEGTALGHVPTTIKETSLIPKIELARDAGITMAMTTQCLYGRVHPLVYSNLREVSSRGVIYCEDMLPETAYVKLMWVLGHSGKPREIRQMMLSNYVGEISEQTLIEDPNSQK